MQLAWLYLYRQFLFGDSIKSGQNRDVQQNPQLKGCI